MLGYEPVLEKKIRGKPVLGDAITCLMSHSEIMFYSEINLVLEIDSLLTIRTPLEAMSLFFMWL